MIFLRIPVRDFSSFFLVLTLQQNDLSQNIRMVRFLSEIVLTLQQNDLSQNALLRQCCLYYVLTLQQNDLSQNSIDIIYFMLDT